MAAMLSEEEVLRVLEIYGSELSFKESSSITKGLLDVMDNIPASLFDNAPFVKNSSKQSLEQLKLLKGSHSLELSFYCCLSEMIKLDEIILAKEFPKISKNIKEFEELSNENFDIQSIDEFYFFRNLYYKNRFDCWNLLQEIIRIDMDPNHIYNSQASSKLNDLLNRGLLQSIISHIKELLLWKNVEIDSNKFDKFTKNDINKLIRVNNLYIADAYMKQIDMAVETLILLCYSRQNLNMIELFDIMIQFFSIPSLGAVLVGYNKLDSDLLSLQFKYFILLISNFQFWRIYSDKENIDTHPILLDKITSNQINKISDLCLLAIHTTDDNKNISKYYLSNMALFIWNSFLLSFKNQSNIISEYIDDYKITINDDSIQLFEYFVLLFESVFERNNYSEVELSHNKLLYCNIAQEAVNLLIQTSLDKNSNDGFISNIHLITRLIEFVYRNNEELCTTLWSIWETNDQTYPLYRLLQKLLTSSSHDPIYLVRILNSIVCSSSSCYIALDLLNQPVYLNSEVDCKNLKTEKLNFLNKKNVSSGLRVSLKTDSNDDLLSLRKKQSNFNICNPSVGCEGIVMSLTSDGEKVLVRWEFTCIWWSLLFNNMIAIINKEYHSDDDHYNIFVYITLLGRIISYQKVLGAYFIETKFNELCLYSLLQDLNCLNNYSLLSDGGETIDSLKRDFKSAKVRLLKLNINGNDIDMILSRVENKSSNKSFYNLSISAFIGTLIQKSFDFFNKSDPKGNYNSTMIDSSLFLINSIQDISHTWAIGLLNVILPDSYDQRCSNYLEVLSKKVFSNKSKISITEKRDTNIDDFARISNLLNLQLSSLIKCLVLANLIDNPLKVLIDKLDINDGDTTKVKQDIHSLSLTLNRSDIDLDILDSFLKRIRVIKSNSKEERYLQIFNLIGDVGNDSVKTSLTDGKSIFQILELLSIATSNIYAERYIPIISESFFTRLSVAIGKADSFSDSYDIEKYFAIISNYFSTFLELLSNAKYDEKINMIELLFFSDNKDTIEFILQISLVFGLTASLVDTGSKSLKPKSFKDLLKTQLSISAEKSISKMPFNYAEKMPLLSINAIDILLDLSMMAIEIIGQIITIVGLENNKRVDSIRYLEKIFCSRALIPKSILLLFSSSSARTTDIEISYFNVLSGMMDFNLGVHSMKLTYKLREKYINLFSYVIEILSESSTSFFSEQIGLNDTSVMCKTICEIIQSGCDNSANMNNASFALNLILLICKKQPLFFSRVLSINKDGDNLTSLSESLIINTIYNILAKVEYIYEEYPMALHLTYQIIKTLWKSKGHPLFLKLSLHFIQMPKVWDFITAPLMIDAPKYDIKGASVTSADNSFVSGVDYSRESVNQFTQKLFPVVLKEEKNKVSIICQQLICHSSALELLSLERYGIFFEMDYNIAIQINNKIELFYIKANECHRFISWIKHYLKFSVDIALNNSIYNQAKAFGIELKDMQNLNCNDFDKLVTCGEAYIYSTKQLRNNSKNIVEILFMNNNLSVSASDEIFCRLLSIFEKNVCQYNFNSSYSDCCIALIKSWKSFLEFYVLPGSNIKQYNLQRFGSINSSTSECKGDIGSGNVGAMSPMVGDSFNASPLTMSKASNFSGDKRSYEIVTEIVEHLTCHRKDGIINTKFGVIVISEKCELLVSMLHHQLKIVSVRASNPSKSLLIHRDTGTTRLTQIKMEKLLEILSLCYSELIIDNEFENTTGHKFINLIKSRLLTSMMLLLSAIHTFDGSDDASSKYIQTRRSVFQLAYATLFGIIKTNGFTVLKETAVNDKIADVAQLKSIIYISIQVMKLSLPKSNGSPLISLTDNTRWKQLSSANNVIVLLINIFRQLSEFSKEFANHENNYFLWRQSELLSGEKGSYKATLPNVLNSNTNNIKNSSDYNYLLSALVGVSDILLCFISSNILDLESISLINSILKEIIESPLLIQYQDVLSKQQEPVASVLMGYDSVSGEESTIHICWKRVLNIVSTIIVVLHTSSGNENPPAELSNTYDLIYKFLNKFSRLILMPLQNSSHRYSIKQLELMKIIINMFVYLNTYMKTYNLFIPDIYKQVRTKIFSILKGFSLLLWHGDDMETIEQQRRLHSHCIAISREENREEVSPRRIDNKLSEVKSTSQEINIRAADNLLLKRSVGKSKLNISISRSDSPLSYIHNEEFNEFADKYHTVIEFLLDFEIHALAAMVPIVSFIRHITPFPLEANYSFGKPIFDVGSTVFYVSDITNSLEKGFIVGLKSNNYLEVVLPNNSVEKDVNYNNVKYTSAPLFDFKSISELTKRSLDEDINTNNSDVSNISTAHLYRSLQLVTSSITIKRVSTNANIAQDLQLLAGQLSWLLVHNLYHYSYYPNGREQLLINQLNDIRKTIRSRDSSETKASPHINNALDWMSSSDWLRYVHWIDNWGEEINFKLGTYRNNNSQLLEIQNISVDESESDHKQRKKRMGLRAKIEWVQSPEDI